MDRKELIVDQQHMYALTVDKDGQCYLEVVCGGIAMENMVLPLNREEMESYNLKGKSFLDELSWEICKYKKKFENRFV
jgi:hypothetical protein